MLPKWHILFGGIFSLILYFFLNINFLNSLIVFLSSVLIDFDHYIYYIWKEKDWSLKNAYDYLKPHGGYKKIIVLLHTVEFLIFVFILSFFWILFFYIFIGMLFHSVFDIAEMMCIKAQDCKEFSLIRHLYKKLSE